MNTRLRWRYHHGRLYAKMGEAGSLYELSPESDNNGRWIVRLINTDPRLRISLGIARARDLEHAKQLADWHYDKAISGVLNIHAAAQQLSPTQ